MKIFKIILLLILITSCSFNKVSNNHGIKLLESKSKKVSIGKSNINDILKILGPPSVKSEFDENLWFYIERKKTTRTIFKLGSKKTIKNNVLVLLIDDRGILNEKELFDIDDMENIKFDKSKTLKSYEKDTYLYTVFTSLREKINSPTRKKKKIS